MGALLTRVMLLGLAQAFVVGWVLHDLHAAPELAHQVYEAAAPDPVWHYLRDASLAVVPMVIACSLATSATRRVLGWLDAGDDGIRARLVFAAVAGTAVAAATVVGAVLHANLFEAHHDGVSTLGHAAGEAIVALRYAFAVTLVFSLVAGVPRPGRGAPSPATATRASSKELHHAHP